MNSNLQAIYDNSLGWQVKIDISDVGTPQPDQDIDANLPVKSQHDAFNLSGIFLIMRHMTLN